ncbi:MAG TPA: ligase-associated DNA damage response endonuclease PdeM [Acetobacteraceae bacterium]|nr:ligase-associated DNA damage response endonuclease PdeM [Acetobacteraceae bacterium]
MSAAPIHVAGERLMLDPAGVLVWPEARLLAVADLHLEKGSACARRGQLVPPWDSRLTLDRLAHALRHWRPRIVVALGDSFHDAGGSARLPGPDAARLRRMAAEHRWIWVLGNHDPAPPEGLGGEAVAEWAHGKLCFRHEATPGASGEISGHFHPKARIATRAGEISRPCFVADARRVLLPAFGTYTGGLNVTDPAIARLFPRGARAFLLGQERLFSFTLAQARAAEAPALIAP